MEQITVQIKARNKAKMLRDLLQSLDFVESVQLVEASNGEANQVDLVESGDFFSLEGIWADRDIDLASIRRAAWPRQQARSYTTGE
jgi:hypothetical protein